jgi:hypothetical protein
MNECLCSLNMLHIQEKDGLTNHCLFSFFCKILIEYISILFTHTTILFLFLESIVFCRTYQREKICHYSQIFFVYALLRVEDTAFTDLHYTKHRPIQG